MPDSVPGFWIHLVESDARALAQGTVPPAVQLDVQTMLADYDAHLARSQEQLDKGARRAQATR
jgi:hypothetical protein